MYWNHLSIFQIPTPILRLELFTVPLFNQACTLRYFQICFLNNYITYHYGKNITVVFDGYEEIETKTVEQNCRSAGKKMVPIIVPFSNLSAAKLPKADFLPNNTNKYIGKYCWKMESMLNSLMVMLILLCNYSSRNK